MKIEQYAGIKSKIRNFLLQHSRLYQDTRNQRKSLGMLKIAQDLEPQCQIGVRRLQKYLSKTNSQKDLSINIEDIFAFADLANQNKADFLNYLFDEQPEPKDTPAKAKPIYAQNLPKCSEERWSAMATVLADLSQLTEDQFRTIAAISKRFQTKNQTAGLHYKPQMQSMSVTV